MNKRIKKKHWKKAFAWVSAQYFGLGFYLSEEENANLSELIKNDRYREAALFVQEKHLRSIMAPLPSMNPESLSEKAKSIREKIESIAKDIVFEY